MKKIKLSQNKYALVDDSDFEELSEYQWCAIKQRNTFYATRGGKINNKIKIIYMHRQILGLTKKPEQCDHINGNGLDNQRENLRKVTNLQNIYNSRKKNNNKSGYKGVSWNKRKKRWEVFITVNYRNIFLGCFLDVKKAAETYNNAAKKYHGQFARLNKI